MKLFWKTLLNIFFAGKKICFILSIFLIADSLLSQSNKATITKVPNLDIVLKSEYRLSKEERVKYIKKWRKSCKTLGNSFKVRKSSLQHGGFNKFKCYELFKSKKQIKKRNWQLLVLDGKNRVYLDVYYYPNPKKSSDKTLMARFSFSSSENTFKALADKKIARKISYLLLDQLPFSRVISKKNWERKKFSSKDIKPKKKKKKKTKKKKISNPEKLNPYRNYYLYTLSYSKESSRWEPNYLGLGKKSKSKTTKKSIIYNWKIIKDGNPLDNQKAIIFASHYKGRSFDKEELEKHVFYNLKKYGISDKPNNLLLDTIASGYTGIRYGIPILKKTNIIAKSSTVSAFADIRGGPIKGLRFMYDLAPKVSEIYTDGQIAEFSWNRVSLGLSMGIEYDFWLTNRIDIMPKIGLTNFKANLPVTNSETGQTTIAPFKLNNEYALGVEVGIEKASPWFLVRAWGSSDFAGIGGATGSVSNIRGGIDTYWELFNIGNMFDFELLIFALGERIKMTPSEKTTSSTGSATANAIKFNLAFTGVGITISW